MRVIFALIFGLLATAGALSVPYWTQNADFRSATPSEELALAERFGNDVRTRNFSDANALMVPAYRPTDTIVYGKLADMFPRGQLARTRVTSWTKTISNGGETMRLELFFEYEKQGAVRTIFKLTRDNGRLQVFGVNFEYFKDDVLHANDFVLPATVRDARWLGLATAVGVDLFAFATFALCIVGPAPRWRWRWLWLIFILIGVLRYNLNWATGEVSSLPFTFLLPPAGLYRFATYGPWFLSLTAPLGAAAYWAYRARWRHEALNAPADIRG